MTNYESTYKLLEMCVDTVLHKSNNGQELLQCEEFLKELAKDYYLDVQKMKESQIAIRKILKEPKLLEFFSTWHEKEEFFEFIHSLI